MLSAEEFNKRSHPQGATWNARFVDETTQFSPKWSKRIQQEYGLRDVDSKLRNQTIFGRNALLQDALITCLPNAHTNILYVGPGCDGEWTWPYQEKACASEPFELAARLDKARNDYRMTILDVNAKALLQVKSRNEIFFDAKKLRSEEWKEYLALTDQTPRVEDTIEYACIPSSFEKKRLQGAISFVEGDIFDVMLRKKYDIVYAMNVLYHINNDNHVNAMLHAIHNMAKHTKSGGIIAVESYSSNKNKHNDDTYVYELLTCGIQDKMGIRHRAAISQDWRMSYHLYEKVGP